MRYICTSIVATLLLAGTSFAATINVPGDYTTIQAAVDAASDGDEIIVAPGTYTDTQDGHVVDMEAKAITLRSTDGAAVTMIDGQNARRGIACYQGETNATVIDGFTITNGHSVAYDYNGDGSIDGWENDGGGIYCHGTSPTIANCTITTCAAPAGDGSGGGVFCGFDSSPTLANCSIFESSATYGGGIYCFLSSPTITDCTISGNTAADLGGGVHCYDSSPTLANCSIFESSATYGGGIYCNYSGNPTITDCTISGNTAALDGGGIYCTDSNPTITNCTITANTADYGGGIRGQDSSLTMTDTTLRENNATTHGGGVAIYGVDSNWSVTNCQFIENTAGTDGAGVYSVDATTTFDQCAIRNNSGGFGSGMYIAGSSDSEIHNSIVTGNNSETYGGGISCLQSSIVQVVSSVVSGNSAGSSGGGIDTTADISLENTFVCGNVPDQISGAYTNEGGNTIEEVCTDTDGDGIPDGLDNCDLYNPDQADCNDNGIGDVCDVAGQTSYDCNQNGVPDECESDCDGDGVIDDCDNDPDADGDGIPDNCETDCNGNTIPDHFEIEQGWAPDCNGNGVPDECDLWDLAYDCDDNGAIDSCEIADDPGLDCDGNGTLDACDPLDDTTDCDGNGLLDICEIAVDPDLDCDGSGVLDTCEFVYWYTMRTKPLASDGEAGDNFGYGIGVEGDVALVSARNDGDNGDQSGSVYVFERQLDGQWSETGKFSGDDTTEGDTFGVGVSVDGDLAAISAPFDDGQGGDRTGSVYIFQRQGDESWSQVDKILAPEGTVDADFGTDVSLNGNRLLIGAARDDDSATNAGSAFIYERSESGDWVQQAKLLASDGDGWHYFGVGVALSGDRAMVGAPKYDGDTGVVYEFQRQEDGSWNELGKIGASNGTNGDVYGGSIALEDNRLFVNSYREQGFLYVYDRDSAGEWIEVDILPGPDTGDNEGFGYDVALDGNQLLAGAHGDSNENGEGAGSFYIFQRTSKLDCDANGVVDSCEMADDPSLDCDSDGILDSCAFAEGLVEDCDQDGLIDTCEIADDPLLDQNNNGLLDQCECLADIAGGGEPGDGDGVVDVNDVLAVIGFWGSAGPIGDIDFDGVVGVNDLLFVLSAWGPCP